MKPYRTKTELEEVRKLLPIEQLFDAYEYHNHCYYCAVEELGLDDKWANGGAAENFFRQIRYATTNEQVGAASLASWKSILKPYTTFDQLYDHFTYIKADTE